MKRQARVSRRLANLYGFGSRRPKDRKRAAGKKRAFLVEPLEARNLLAGDLYDGLTLASGSDSGLAAPEAPQAAFLSEDVGLAAFNSAAFGEQTAEGESQPDLVAFA